MAKKTKVDVFLTVEALDKLKEEPSFKVLLKNSKYLSCKSIEQNGYFLDMTIPFPSKKVNLPDVVLSIPYNYVLYVLSGNLEKAPGFSIPEMQQKNDDEG